MIGSCTAIRVLICRFRRAAAHTVTTMGQAVTGMPGSYDELMKAPEHVVDLLLGMMRPYPEQPGGPPPGSVDYMRAARAEARIYADRIWQEAATAGAVVAQAPVRVIGITAPGMPELGERAGENVQPWAVDTTVVDGPAEAAAGPPGSPTGQAASVEEPAL